MATYRIDLVRHVDHANEQLVSAHVSRNGQPVAHVSEEGSDATLREARQAVRALRKQGRL